MPASRSRIVLVVPPIVAIGWLHIAFVMPEHEWGGRYIVSHQFGTMIGQTSVAAAWAAFGPGRWKIRVPLSLLWVCLLVVALYINHCLHFRTGNIFVALLPLAGLLSQWLLVQLLFSILARMFRVRMVHENDLGHNPEQTRGTNGVCLPPQFGTGQLMIFTAIVAMAIGVLRVIVLASIVPRDELLVLGSLVIAAVVITLPLFISAVPGRGWTVVTMVALSLIAVIISSEFGLREFIGLHYRTPNDWHCVWMYSYTAFWVLLPVCATRLTGYVLTNQPTS